MREVAGSFRCRASLRFGNVTTRLATLAIDGRCFEIHRNLLMSVRLCVARAITVLRQFRSDQPWLVSPIS
jgi:hypothetical protein